MMQLNYYLSILLSLLTFTSYSQWEEQGCGFENAQGLVFGVSVPQPGVAWGVLEQVGFTEFQTKAAVTLDDGNTWNIYDIDTLSTFTCIKVKALDNMTAFASTLTFPEEDSTRIYRTQDSGVSWQLIPSAFSGPYEACIDFHFFDDDNGVAFGAPITGPMTIYTTSDGGDSWVKVLEENLPETVTDEGMVITTGNGSYGASNDNLWFGTTSGRIYKTMDKGLTWEAITVDTSRSINSVAFKDDLHGIATSVFTDQVTALTTNRCWTTPDGGNSWTEVNDLITNPRMDMVQYIPGSENTYLCTSSRAFALGGTMISFDGGLTWTDIDNQRLYGAEFLSESEGWAGGFTESTDEGIFKWEGYTSVLEFNKVQSLAIYPTLASNHITISNLDQDQPGVVQIIDMNGKTVSTLPYSSNLDVSSLSPGVYQLLIIIDNSTSSGRFIKK